jgi:hypothetical protein
VRGEHRLPSRAYEAPVGLIGQAPGRWAARTARGGADDWARVRGCGDGV